MSDAYSGREPVTAPGIHDRAPATVVPPFTQAQLRAKGQQWIEEFLKQVLLALKGVFTFGIPSFDQLRDWAEGLAAQWQASSDAVQQQIMDWLTGIVDSTETDLDNWLLDLANGNASWTQLGQIVQGELVTPVTAAVADFKDWWNSLVGWQDSTTTTATDIQNTQIATTANGVPRQPKWVSPYPLSDVTYPVSMHINQWVRSGATGAASAGTAHTHGAGTLQTGTTSYATGQGNSNGAVMTITNTMVVDTIGYAGSRDAAVDAVFLEVFKVNEDGSATRVSSTNVTATISTGADEYRFVTLPSPLLCQAGEEYLLRLRNASTVAGDVWVIAQPGGGLGPQGSFVTVGSSLTNQTAYTSGEMATALSTADKLCWFMLGAGAPPLPELAYSDNFDRTLLGNLYLTKSTTASQLAIIGNALQYNGVSNGTQAGIYVRKTNYNASKVEAYLSVNPLAVLGQRVGIMLHCNQDLSQVVFLGVGPTDSKLYSGGWNSLTERASDGDAGSGLWAAYWDDTAGKYIVLKNGDPTGLEWAAGGATVRDENHRFGGARISLNTLITAGSVDNFSLRDWKP